MHQGGRQGGLLLHAVAVRINGIVSGGSQVEHAQQLFEPALCLGAVQVIQAADKAKQLAAAQLGIQVGGVGHVAAGSLGKQGLRVDIVTGDFHQSFAGLEQADDHLDGGRLPGAIGAEEAKNLSGRYLEAHIFHRRFIAVVFGQVLGLDQRCVRHRDNYITK